MSEKWYKKIKSFVPSWVYEDENQEKEKTVAILKALAAGFEQAEQDAIQGKKNSFVSDAEEDYVKLHGEERSIERFAGESLSAYRERVKIIVNNCNIPALKNLITPLLIRGEPNIIEHYNATGGFFNRESYLNRNMINFEVLLNAFTIIIENQIPEPRFFFNRENFVTREEFIGSKDSIDSIFENVIKSVNKNQADGTVYRLIERN